MTEPATQPLVWRIPAYQPALLMLALCAAAALNIYGHPSATVRIVTLAIGLVCGFGAVAALRVQVVADEDGIAVRQVISQAWLPWSEVEDLEVMANVRGAPTVRLNRLDGTYVDVPPSLLQPTKPTNKRQAFGQLENSARELRARRPSTR